MFMDISTKQQRKQNFVFFVVPPAYDDKLNGLYATDGRT